MKKSCFWIFAFSLVVSLPSFSIEVDEKELKSTGDADSIVFVNYTGPHSRIDSIESIKKLGSDLGIVISKDITKKNEAGTSSKYSVIHVVDPSQQDKLDADIIFIGKNAGVDHIKNLRLIIASYLVAAYGYSEQDAQTVAVFVTVYNAVYRGKIDSYKNKYKDAVLKNLSSENCGLALNYKEWAGSSQIVIPLFDVKGGLSTVDTSVISDTEVVKRMQEDDDRNVEARKEMVDIKEREAEKASEKAQTYQKEAVQEQKKLVEEKVKTETVKKQAEEAKKEAENAQKLADENPEDKDLQEKVAELKEKSEEKQQEYEEQKAVEKNQEVKTEEAKKEAAVQQATADKKTAEAIEERKNIAKDQMEVIQKEMQDAVAPSAYGIELTDEKNMLSGLIKINTSTGKVIKSSPVTFIRNRTMFQTDEGFIAIAGENVNNGAVKLVLLAADTMDISKESNEIVHENSVLVQDSSEYYCVVQDGKSWVLAKYGQDLSLKLKSSVPLKPSTPVTVSVSHVIVTLSDGSVCVLDKSNLNPVSTSYSSMADEK